MKNTQELTNTSIQLLLKGDYFRIPGKKPVYVYDGYNRHTGRYSAHKFDDICAFREWKKGTEVEINFTF